MPTESLRRIRTVPFSKRFICIELFGNTFTLLIVLRLEEGKRVYREPECDTDTAQRQRRKQVVELLENLLSFLSFCTRGQLWRVDDQSGECRFKDCCAQMINKILEVTPRDEGNGWNISKVHWILDLAYYVAEYGRPGNFDCAIGERNLRFLGRRLPEAPRSADMTLSSGRFARG